MYTRPVFHTLFKRLNEPRRFIQVLTGPRQVGKSTIARQLAAALPFPVHVASADDPMSHDRAWIEQQWDIAEVRMRSEGSEDGLLILDEVQKIVGWSETVKRLWDAGTVGNAGLRVLLLGSAPLLIQQGLGESLAGRFEVVHATHWSFGEMHEAFRWNLDQYLYFGGYPGSVTLINDENRWKRYILDALVETTISRDVLLMSRVDKPALLRRLFRLACEYSGQIVSYQKMVGQLQDAGNTTTLAHYLDLLDGVGMVAGLQKYAGERIRQRGSSPKLQVFNTALMSVQSGLGFQDALRDREFWGRLVESAVGAYLLNGVRGTSIELFYWRERHREVDFVLNSARTLVAIEVKSGRAQDSQPGMDEFALHFPTDRKLLVGGSGMPLETFFTTPLEMLLR